MSDEPQRLYFYSLSDPPPYHHKGGIHAPGQERVGLGNGQFRASWQQHAPAPRRPWKGDAVRYHTSVGITGF